MVPLICPACATWTSERIDVRTVERIGDVMVCECGRRYPIIDEVPIVLARPGPFLRSEIASVVERDLSPEVAALLVDGGDDAPYARFVEHVSTYVDAHWGDRADPPPDGLAGYAMTDIALRLARLPHVAHVVELGCSAGRAVAELAARADHVVGLELAFGVARRARRILAGEPVGYLRRVVGRHYTAARVTTSRIANATIVCGDALDPPLVPRHFDRVVALNLLDSVADPRKLLDVVDGLCADGGEIILASPYAWRHDVTADDRRIGGAAPAAAVIAMLADRYRVEDEAELTWSLRRDARSAATYRSHYLRARKLAAM